MYDKIPLQILYSQKKLKGILIGKKLERGKEILREWRRTGGERNVEYSNAKDGLQSSHF